MLAELRLSIPYLGPSLLFGLVIQARCLQPLLLPDLAFKPALLLACLIAFRVSGLTAWLGEALLVEGGTVSTARMPQPPVSCGLQRRVLRVRAAEREHFILKIPA